MDKELRDLIRDVIIGVAAGIFVSWLVWGNGIIHIINWIRV